MNAEFQDCLDRKKIYKFPSAKQLVNREILDADEDLKVAQDSFEKERYKWATIQAYFSMFHCARALLYKEGYREKSHYCLIIALRTLYINKGIISHKIVEDFQLAKNMRERADYHAEYSKEDAEALIKSAEEFLNTAKQNI